MPKTALAIITGMLLCIASFTEAQTGLLTFTPKDTGEALVNPNMGWTMHYYSDYIQNYGSKLEPSDTLDDFPGLSCVFLRLPWSHIEKEEGVFNWSIVDTPAQRWIDKGKQVAFRFTCCESFMRYSTPQWVEKAGAKGYNFKPGEMREDGPYWEPDYGDPVFLEKLDHFLAAAAKRYDGNPNVAFIDIGSLGVWGEGHTFHSTKKIYSLDVLKKHVDLHVKHFKKTILAINDDFVSHDPAIIDYAFGKGITLRDDSILVQAPPKSYFHADLAQKIFSKLPVILECEHYGSSKARGAWGDGSNYLKAVEDYHAAYASIHWWPREFMNEQLELIKKMNLRLGYRLQLREISWPGQISLKDKFSITMKWANAGAAPCYPGGYITLTLKDAKGGIVSVFVDESFNVRDLKEGPVDAIPVTERNAVFSCSEIVKPGKYDMFISVGKEEGTPVIALPLVNPDNHRRYKLGQIEITD